MRTLLQLCQDVCRDTAYPNPTAIVTATNDTARRLLAAAQLTMDELARASWVALVRESVFQTAANIADYALPEDFGSIINDTVWDRSNSVRSPGGLNAQDWQVNKSGGLDNVVFSNYRLKVKAGVKRFYLTPTPGGVSTLAFEYRSNAPIRKYITTGADEFLSVWGNDSDEPILDDDLVKLGITWRFLKRQGEAYGEEKDEYDHRLEIALAQDPGPSTVNLQKRPFSFKFNTGQTNFDT